MELNFHEALAYLDGLISQKIEKENISKSTEFKFFCITPEEVERYLKSSNFDTKQTFISKQCLPGLDILGKLFHLSELEKQILLIVLAPEIDVKYERIYAYLQDDLTRKYPTISLISFLLCKDEAERLRILPYFLPHSPLFKFRLLRFVGNSTETSWLSCPLRLEESVRNFILGYYSLDNRLKTFANIEVSYLLQRIEEYNGIVILASNFHRNIDEAFVRRMHFIAEFPFPDEKMRQEIWQKVFPEETPLEQTIDFALLAKEFKLSGANIRNAASAAAFYAAENKEKNNKGGLKWQI